MIVIISFDSIFLAIMESIEFLCKWLTAIRGFVILSLVNNCSSGTSEPQTRKLGKNKSFSQILAVSGFGLITRRSQVQVLPPLLRGNRRPPGYLKQTSPAVFDSESLPKGDMDVAAVETTHILAYLNYLRTDYVPRRITGNNDNKLSPKTVYNLY